MLEKHLLRPRNTSRRVGGVVTQRFAKPRTPVQFRYSPPNLTKYKMKKLITFILTITIILANSFDKALSASTNSNFDTRVEATVQKRIISDYFIDKDGFGEIIRFFAWDNNNRYICSLKISHDNYNCQVMK